MIEFNTADGEKLTIMHDRVAVKGYPGSDRSVLFIGGNFHALLHSYDEVVAKMDAWVYGPDKLAAEMVVKAAYQAEENHQTQDAQQAAEPLAPTEEEIAKVVADERARRESAAQAKVDQAAGADTLITATAATEAPGAGTEHQSA